MLHVDITFILWLVIEFQLNRINRIIIYVYRYTLQNCYKLL